MSPTLKHNRMSRLMRAWRVRSDRLMVLLWLCQPHVGVRVHRCVLWGCEPHTCVRCLAHLARNRIVWQHKGCVLPNHRFLTTAQLLQELHARVQVGRPLWGLHDQQLN